VRKKASNRLAGLYNLFFHTLELFGFGKSIISSLAMFYRVINSSGIINFDTSERLPLSKKMYEFVRVRSYEFVALSQYGQNSLLP